LPYLADFTHNLHGCKIYSTLDLSNAFLQIPVHTDDIQKTAITTTCGLFAYRFMPYGLRNAPQTCQRFIDEVTRGLPFVFAYLDDILIASRSHKEHLKHLRILLKRLDDYGLILNPQKCVLGAKSVKFLGFSLSEDGLKPLKNKVAVIKDYPLPKTLQQLRRFLGIVNFYRKFQKNAASVMEPLNKLLSGEKRPSKTPIEWTDITKRSFEKSKSLLANATLLAHPIKNAPLSIVCDASNSSMGGVLQQFANGIWQPLGFFSKNFCPAQKKYSTYDRELLAIFSTIKYFRHMLEGRQFKIYTDHKPLIHAFTKNRDNLTPRQFRQLDYISQFSTDIHHIAGQANTVADALSRIDCDAIKLVPHVDYAALARDQHDDEELRKLKMHGTALNFEPQEVENSEYPLYCDVSNGIARPYVTEKFRHQIFEKMHSLSHPGIKASVRLICHRFVWPYMKRDIKSWSRSCTDCQPSKVTRHVKTPLVDFQNPTKRFSAIHADLVGPLRSSHAQKYLLTIIDRYSRWFEAIPIPNMEATTVCKMIYEHWICRFGAMESITTDQGRQFESHLFRDFANLFGIKLKRTTAYHPQCNGMIERFHRDLKAALMAHNNPAWREILPTVLLGLRAQYREELQASPAELTYGEPLRLPGEFFVPSEPNYNTHELVQRLRTQFANLRPTPASRHCQEKSFVFKNLDSAKSVYERDDTVRPPLQRPYNGPYPVIHRNSKNMTILKNNKHVVVSKDRLKPAYQLATETNTNTSSCHLSVPETVAPALAENDTPHVASQRRPTDGNPSTAANEANVSSDEILPQDRVHTTTRSGRKVRCPERYTNATYKKSWKNGSY